MKLLLIFLLISYAHSDTKNLKEESQLNKALSEALSELNVENQKQNLAASQVVATHQFCLPVEVQKIKKMIKNGKILEIELKEKSEVYNMHDGQVISIKQGCIKIQHVIEGGIAVISSIECHDMSLFVKEGDIIVKKQVIGHAKHIVSVAFYDEDGLPQDYSDYIAQNSKKTKSKIKIEV